MAIERSHRAALAGLFTLIMGLAGCERLLDIERAESVIKSGLNEQLKMAFASVECPESRAMKAGDEFDCKATAEGGGVLTIKVTQNDDAGNIKWTLVDGERVLAIENLEKQIKDSIAKQIKVDATIDCGATRRRIAVAGQTIECSASDGTESRKVIVTLKDDRGNVDWTLK